VGESRKSRTGLVAGIGLAAVALVAGGLYVTKDRWLGARPPVTAGAPKTEPAPAGAATAVSGTSEQAVAPSAVQPEAVKVVDPRAVEAEARRVTAEREKALREAAKQPVAAGKPTTASVVPPAPAVGLAAVKAAEPPRPNEVSVAASAAASTAAKAPESASAATPVSRAPEPKPAETVAEAKAVASSPVEVSVPDKAPVIPASSNAPVAEGDLVGPGEGVVEPRLVRLGSISGLPVQARQIKRAADGTIGTPFLMALVDEKGTVQDIRVIKPSSYRFVDEAAMRSLKNATIQPATKDGVKVKMWKTFPINVKP